jgi:hypothetical protein
MQANDETDGIHMRNKEVNLIHHKEMLELQLEARTSYVIHTGYLSSNMFNRSHGVGKWVKKFVEFVQMTVPLYDSAHDREKQREDRKIRLAAATEGQKKGMLDRHEWVDKMYAVFYKSEKAYQHRLYVRDAVKGAVELPVGAEMEREEHIEPLENARYHFLCISLDANGFSAGFDLAAVDEPLVNRFKNAAKGVVRQVDHHLKHNQPIMSGDIEVSGFTKHKVAAETISGLDSEAMVDECRQNAQHAVAQDEAHRHQHSFFLRGLSTADVDEWVQASKLFENYGPKIAVSPLQPRMDARAKGLTVGKGQQLNDSTLQTDGKKTNKRGSAAQKVWDTALTIYSFSTDKTDYGLTAN